jgi:hypothetical protein
MGIDITKIWPTSTGPASEGGADPVCHGPPVAAPNPYEPGNPQEINVTYCADGASFHNSDHSNDAEICCPGAAHSTASAEDVSVDIVDFTFGTGEDDDLQPNPYLDPGSDPSGGPGDYNGPGDFNGPGTGGSGGDGPGNEGDNGVIAFNGGAGGGGGEGNGGGSGGGDNGGSGSGGDNGGGSGGGDNGGNGSGGGDNGGSGSGMPSDDGTDSNGGNNQIAVIGHHAAGGGDGDGSAGSFNGDGEGTDVNLIGGLGGIDLGVGAHGTPGLHDPGEVMPDPEGNGTGGPTSHIANIGLGGIDLGVGVHGTPGLHDPGEVRPDPEGSGTGGPTSHIANITFIGGAGGFWDQAANAAHGETTDHIAMLINAATSGAMTTAHEFSAASHGLDHAAAFASMAEGHDAGLSIASFAPADLGSVNLHEHHGSTFETQMFI